MSPGKLPHPARGPVHPGPIMLLLQLLVIAAGTAVAAAQAPPAPYRSMGQPSRWHPYAALGGGVAYAGRNQGSGTLTLGLYRDWLVPVAQALGPALEIWGRVGEPHADAGARLHLASPGTLWRVGLDQSLDDGGGPALILGIDAPVARGGLLLDGGQLRLDWIPARAQLDLGYQLPLGSRWIGHTRRRDIDADLPRARAREPAPLLSPEVTRTLDLVGHSAGWLAVLTCGILWDDTPRMRPDDLQRLRAFTAGLREHIAATDSLRPQGHSYGEEIVLYHHLLDRLFGLALGAPAAAAAEMGRPVADAARQALLERVLLPYDRAFGQVKEPDSLDGLAVRAEIQFADWLLSRPGYGPAAIARAEATFRALLGRFERVRQQVRDESRVDRDLVWLPLQWALRPEQIDSQAELDRILARAAGRPFCQGNATVLINALQFAEELHHQIGSAEDYHVLWIHDYRGRDSAGDPDALGFAQTLRYVETMARNVRAYDRTGKLPAFFMFLDQNYYDPNHARLWLDVLERPLDHELRLDGEPYAAWADSIAAAQQHLRDAVAASSRLQAEAAAGGGQDWVRKVVKVHVSVTNPADLTFRSDRMLPGVPAVPDAVARDHRKIAFYDLSARDPGRGAAVVTGTGVGEHYASPTWEDRALRVRGPGALEMKNAARRLLLSQGFGPREIPAPLRETAPPPDYDARVRALGERGWTASVLSLHNETGFGAKDATVANMILYTLAPPGTELWIPDSIWTSRTIAAALTGAALRGCSVLVVAPALANAPSAGFPQMSRSRVMLGIMVEFAAAFEDAITAAGGRLHVGMYTRTMPDDDIAGRLRSFARSYREDALLRELFPFGEEAMASLDDLAAHVERAGGPGARHATDVAERLPKLHRKTQFLGTSEAVRALARAPETFARFRDVLDRVFRARADGGATRLGEAAAAAAVSSFESVDARLPADLRARRLYYMTVGSVNKDSRSNFVDGETMVVVSGVWGLGTYFDFFLLLADTEWLASQEDLEAHFPQYSGFQHRLGRFLRRLL